MDEVEKLDGFNKGAGRIFRYPCAGFGNFGENLFACGVLLARGGFFGQRRVAIGEGDHRLQGNNCGGKEIFLLDIVAGKLLVDPCHFFADFRD